MGKAITKKKKPITIIVRVYNEPSEEAIINAAKVLKYIGTQRL